MEIISKFMMLCAAAITYAGCLIVGAMTGFMTIIRDYEFVDVWQYFTVINPKFGLYVFAIFAAAAVMFMFAFVMTIKVTFGSED